MRKQSYDSLPHLCAEQQVWAVMKNSNLGPTSFSKHSASPQAAKGSLHSTGSWGLQRKEKCLPPAEGGASCLMCETEPLTQVSPQDLSLLQAAKEKHNRKRFLKKNKVNKADLHKKVSTQKEPFVLSSATLSSFKVSKRRRNALSARSGLTDKRPPPEDNNIWKTLISSRRGYTYSAKILARILTLLRKRGSISHTGPANLSPYQKALWALFAAERANSYRAIENRRGTPAFKVSEVSSILFLCGWKMADDPTSLQPPIHNQDKHYLLQDKQESSYMVPISSPRSALGQAAAKQIHDETCGSSPASAQTRASRYFYFCPPTGNLFKELQQKCFKCRRIRMVKGRDLINPLRHLADATMVPGLSLQIDVAGPFLVKTKSKQAIQTRQEKREKRSTTKMWILLAVDYFTSKLEVSPLEDMTTGSISAAIQDIIIANGWATRRLSLDPGSSLVTAVRDTSEAVADLKDKEENHHEEAVDIHQAR